MNLSNGPKKPGMSHWERSQRPVASIKLPCCVPHCRSDYRSLAVLYTFRFNEITDGWCWWYRKYAPGDTVLEGLENEAREAKKGLWADPRSVPPWEWRVER